MLQFWKNKFYQEKAEQNRTKTKYFVKLLVQIQWHRKKDLIAYESTNLTKYCQRIVETLFDHGIVSKKREENLVKSLSWHRKKDLIANVQQDLLM